MRIEPIGSADMTYSINYIRQIGKVQKIEEIQGKKQESRQRKQENNTRKKMAKKMNAMAEQTQDIVGYYDKTGKGKRYEYFTFEEFQ